MRFQKATSVLLAFAILFSCHAVMAEEGGQEGNEPGSIPVYDLIASDIRQNGHSQNEGHFVWHIQRIDDLDETEYDLVLREDESADTSSITCSHDREGYTFSLVIQSQPQTEYAVLITDAATMDVLATGTIEAESYTGGEEIRNWECVQDKAEALSETAKEETSLLVQLLQTHTVGPDRSYTIADLGFACYSCCNIHAPGLRLVTQMPTCTKSGLCEYDCQICGTHIAEVLPPFRPEDQLDEDHSWVYDSIVEVKDAPHESTANYHCENCGTEWERRFCAADIFIDMPSETKFSHNPIEWAYLHGITKGKTENKFSPKGKCTRAEFLTQLWRVLGSPQPTITETPFTDVREDAYYATPIRWAYENNITTGTTATEFSPKKTCTRGQIITFIWKAMGSPQADLVHEDFDDVTSDDYFYHALMWAMENNVTSGKSERLFGPKDPCTREQVASFLYFSFAR